MPAEKSKGGRRALQPACDACHIRRVKCSHDQPCAHCARLGLTCTYTKASTAKKSAGKRIEALRQAERSAQLNEANYRENKLRAGQPVSAGHSNWNDGHHPSPPSEMTDARGHEMMQHQQHQQQQQQQPPHQSMPPRGETEHHHPYYPSQPGQSQATPYAGEGGSYPAQSPTPWNPLPSSHSSRSRQATHPEQHQLEVEYERQVRFQQQQQQHHHPQLSSTSGRMPIQRGGQYDGMGNMHPYPSQTHSQQQHHHQPGTDPSYHQYSEEMPYAYLPSPSQYFAQPPVRHNSNFSGTGIGDSSMSTSSVMIEDSIAAPSHYQLQTSILPPFSTSMADQLFNEQGVFDAHNFFNEAMPSLVTTDGQQTMLDMLGTCAPSGETPGSIDSSSFGAADGLVPFRSQVNDDIHPTKREVSDASGQLVEEPDALSESVLIPTLGLFYEKLGGVMPVFSRNWLFSKLDKDDHRHEPQFAAMLLAMSALTIIQAQPVIEGKEKRADRTERRRRRAKATQLLDEALRTRDSPLMGQQASLEACFTSFFVFAALFGLGEHSAAWFRLRESITLGHLCRLHEPLSYEGLAKDEAERRLRAYWLLAITERAFAIQRGTPIILTGNPRKMTANLRAKFGFKELSDFPDLQLKLFDVVDENFVDCWNRKCPGQGCKNFNRDRAIALWKSFTDNDNGPSSAPDSARERSFGVEEGGGVPSHDTSENGSAPNSRPRSHSQTLPPTPVHRGQIQKADVEVTRHWLLNRLWLITLSHGLLSIDAKEPPLRVDHAIHIARSVLDVCNYNLSLPSMEAHGVGFTYKLYDIAQTLVMLCKDENIAEAISQGVAGDPLKAQTTAQHTNGRGLISNADNKGSLVESGPTTLVVDTSGPRGLRKTVLRILNEYLILFQKFRGGDHPYLGKLEESIKEVQAQVEQKAEVGEEGELSSR